MIWLRCLALQIMQHTFDDKYLNLRVSWNSYDCKPLFQNRILASSENPKFATWATLCHTLLWGTTVIPFWSFLIKETFPGTQKPVKDVRILGFQTEGPVSHFSLWAIVHAPQNILTAWVGLYYWMAQQLPGWTVHLIRILTGQTENLEAAKSTYA